MSSETHQFMSGGEILIPQKVWEHLGLNANHSGKVLHSVLVVVISSVNPRKRYHWTGDVELQSQLIDATIQGAAEELQKPKKTPIRTQVTLVKLKMSISTEK